MRTRIDARLRHEASQFALRFACDDCAHFDSPYATCAHGYPTTPHRRARLDEGTELIFCKEFDLGAPCDGGTEP